MLRTRRSSTPWKNRSPPVGKSKENEMMGDVDASPTQQQKKKIHNAVLGAPGFFPNSLLPP